MDLLMLLVCAINLVYLATGDKCAEECSCKWKSGKRTVECVDRGLNSIPESIDPETQVLDSSDNDIRILPRNIFSRVRLTNLQRLYLRGCRIDRIDEEAFTGLTNLVELDLSNNLLSNIPTASFKRTPFLRDLLLSNNPLEKIHSYVFDTTPNLVKLDLSYAQLLELKSKGFQGLKQLETLKLNNNHLSTLHPGTFEPLGKLTSIELHENPWICDCHLREMKTWLVKHNLPTLISPVCHGPIRLADKLFTELPTDEFACRPILLISSRYAEATIGENASIVCQVSAIPAARIKWLYNARLLTNHSSFNTYQRILIYEEGQFRKKSTLVLTNAQESEASEFFCVAENEAGSVEANFTLHVSLRTAGISGLGSGQIAGISAALLVLILLILLVIMVLFIRLKRMPSKEVKNSVPVEVIALEPSNTRDNPHQPHSSILGRRKQEDIELQGSFGESKPPGSLDLSYVQRPIVRDLEHQQQPFDHYHHRFDEAHSLVHAAAASFSSTTSLMLIDNPDLIRDTGRGPTEDPPSLVAFGSEFAQLQDQKILYSSYLWESRESPRAATLSLNSYASKEPSAAEPYPPGAKQVRVWQKGVPLLPPVSALKRVLGSTRSSPDEGYQEGTGTDV